MNACATPRAVARALEAEGLAEASPPGRERDLYLGIAYLWRELAQLALLDQLQAPDAVRPDSSHL